MKRNGQALIEFIIILPVLIVLLLGVVDFGIIFIKKSSLENNLDEVTEIWKNTKSLNEINTYLNKVDKKIQFDIRDLDNDIELSLESNVDINTPGLNKVLGNPYKIKVSRVIYNE